jgi:hypothetical protein
MSSFGYFSLETSNASLNKKFRVVFSGYKRTLQKSGNLDKTITGQIDASVGSIQERRQFIVRVRDQEPVEGFGSKTDLETFFRLNDPIGVPI